MSEGQPLELNWKLISWVAALVCFIFLTSMSMVNASQAKQDTLITSDHQTIIELKSDVSAIQQHNVDEDKRLERIENKIDYLITEVTKK